jgi:ribosomal-protein-serine acetyltransferase
MDGFVPGREMLIPYTNLTDGVIHMRPFHFADAPGLGDAVHESLADVKPWMSWAFDGYSQKDAADFIALTRAGWEEGRLYGFAITDAVDGGILGGCSLSHIHPVYHFCNLGYWVRTSRRGLGIAGRAARLSARFALETLGLVRVEVVVALGNQASLRVAEKIGVHREGVLRNRIIVRESVHDAVMFSFVPQDFGLPVTVPSS